MSWHISANVGTERADQVGQVVEVLGRAIAGLALEGLAVGLSIDEIEDDEEEAEEGG